MWDSRATQRYASGDYYPEFRRMHRIIVGGDRPLVVAAQNVCETARARG